jgi:radical SAM protein with 4Fe4S-binding SPASM domain
MADQIAASAPTARAALPADYASLVRELQRRAAARRQPVKGIFELTSRCNLACRMCYVQYPAGDCARQKKELPASAWLALAREAVENGMVFLLLTGGEIFLRADFFDIYEPLTHLGLVLTLFSNGTMITETQAQRLAEAPPNGTEITLYGATAATYEAVTGVPGGYVRCCAGIERLVARRIPLLLKATITRQNVGELEAMRRMANNWGIPFRASSLLTPRRDGRPSEIEHCRLSADQCVALEAADPGSASGEPEAWPSDPTATRDGIFLCQGGKAGFAVSPEGEMNVCLDLPLPAARPLELGFRVAWEHVQRYVDSAPLAGHVCRVCDLRSYCKRCPAWSFLETGTLTEPVPYLCQIASQRKERYGQAL